MVEKFGTSEFDNSTGAYELDLSLTDDFEHAWRTMHVKSDVFCSGSIVLPDKGARQLNVGGWSLDSTQGVRLYWPDGSAGVNGTNDWEENFEELHLQVRFHGLLNCENLCVLTVFLNYSARDGTPRLLSWRMDLFSSWVVNSEVTVHLNRV